MHESAANFWVSENVNFDLRWILRVIEKFFKNLMRLQLKNIVPRILLNQLNENVQNPRITKCLVDSWFIQFNYLE